MTQDTAQIPEGSIVELATAPMGCGGRLFGLCKACHQLYRMS